MAAAVPDPFENHGELNVFNDSGMWGKHPTCPHFGETCENQLFLMILKSNKCMPSPPHTSKTIKIIVLTNILVVQVATPPPAPMENCENQSMFAMILVGRGNQVPSNYEIQQL